MTTNLTPKGKLYPILIVLLAILLAWAMSARGQVFRNYEGYPRIITSEALTSGDTVIVGTTIFTGTSIDGLLIYSGEKKRISINDTVICRTVHFQIGPGVYFDSTFCFVLPKPLPVIIRDTVVIHDTIPRICPICPVCPDTPSTGLKWSDYKGSLTFSQYVALCQSKNLTAIVDMDVAPAMTIEVKGNLKLEGLPGVTIANQLPGPLFRLYEGQHIFRNFRLLQTDSIRGIGFISAIAPTGQLPYVFKDSLDGVNIEGGFHGYESSRGGRKGNWSTVSIVNSTIKTKHVCFSNFSQDGNNKSTYMRNVGLWSTGSHAGYQHPNVSAKLEAVTVYQIGSGALAWHGFSGGGGDGSGAKDSAHYFIMENVNGVGAWQIPKPFTGPVQVTGCNIRLYDSPVPEMIARRTNIQGGPFRGSCDSCTGVFRPVSGSVYTNGVFAEHNMQQVGVVTYVNSKIGKFTGNSKDGVIRPAFEINLNGSAMGAIALESPPYDYRIYLRNGSPVPSGLWGFIVDPAKVITIAKE